MNDAGLELFQYQREEVIGERAGRTAIDLDPATADAQWEELLRTNELYGEHVIEHTCGAAMRLSYAAHDRSQPRTQRDGQDRRPQRAQLVALVLDEGLSRA